MTDHGQQQWRKLGRPSMAGYDVDVYLSADGNDYKVRVHSNKTDRFKERVFPASVPYKDRTGLFGISETDLETLGFVVDQLISVIDTNVSEAFWAASAATRQEFGMPPGPPPEDRAVPMKIDLDKVVREKTLAGVKDTLRNLFNKAHGLFRMLPDDDPEARDCFRELAAWNAIRIMLGFTVEDMAAHKAMAAKAKHPESIWEHGMEVKLPGASEFVPAKYLLGHLRPYG